jgi:hypothetical protein
MNTATVVTPTEPQYFYVKRCHICQAEYYRNPISKEQFDNLADNENIHFEYNIGADDVSTAEIISICDNCAEETALE